MIGLFWNLLLALAWVTLTGSITAMNLLAGFIFGYVASWCCKNRSRF